MGLAAGIIGVVLPGWGQVANRQFVKGLAVFTLMLVGVLGTYLFLKGFILREVAAFAVFFSFSLYSGLDAYLFDPRKQEVQDKQLEEFTEFRKEKKRKGPEGG